MPCRKYNKALKFQMVTWPLTMALCLLVLACGDNNTQNKTFEPIDEKLSAESMSILVHSQVGISSYSIIQRAYKLSLPSSAEVYPCLGVKKDESTKDDETNIKVDIDWSGCTFGKANQNIVVDGGEYLTAIKDKDGIKNIVYMSRGFTIETKKYRIKIDYLVEMAPTKRSRTEFDYDSSIDYKVFEKTEGDEETHTFLEWNTNVSGALQYNTETNSVIMSPVTTNIDFSKVSESPTIGSSKVKRSILTNEKIKMVNVPSGGDIPAVTISSCGSGIGVFDIVYSKAKDTESISDRIMAQSGVLSLQKAKVNIKRDSCSSNDFYFFREVINNIKRYGALKAITK